MSKKKKPTFWRKALIYGPTVIVIALIVSLLSFFVIAIYLIMIILAYGL